MKKLLLLITILFTTIVFSQKEITKVANYVTDNGNFLTTQEENEINSWISQYEKKTSIQIGIVTLKDLEGEDISDYSVRTFNNLGIGKRGANNGILFVFSMNDRKSWITTGSGIEEFLTDEICVDILREEAKPHFKEGNYSLGMLSSLNHIKSIFGEGNIETTKQNLINIAKQKEEWLKQRQAKIDRDNEIKYQKAKDVAIDILGILVVLAVIGYFIRLQWLRSKEVKIINENSDKILNLYSEVKKPELNSSELNTSYISITSKLDSVDWNAKRKVIGNNKLFIEAQERFISSINDLIINHNRILNSVLSKIFEIEGIEEFANECKSTNRQGLTYNNSIEKEFGKQYVVPNIKDVTIEVEDLKDSFTKNNNTIESNYTILSAIKKQMESLVNPSTSTKGVYLALQSKKEFLNSTTNIQNLVTKAKLLSKYDTKNEIRLIEPEIGKYEISKYKYTELLSSYSHKLALYEFINRIVTNLDKLKFNEEEEIRRKEREIREEEERKKRKKREEEEEEERQRRNRNSYSSYGTSFGSGSSSSSSSSDSSFGGFDGGSSSGGGGGGDW